ncbi:MAG TPA: protein-L-isoaspartate O-methyltransferase [Casimicrobiaceae bacterium]|jgi:protein-L-isoaspartate(D-aspartate) O-methyltransferase
MMAFDIEKARYNMVEQQIRPWEVLDERVLDLLFHVRREEFVPREHRALAFADLEIPLSSNARMWTPKMEARVLQELSLKSSDRVLEIGTGSGYFTALLASQAAEVDSIEIEPRLAAEAQAKLARHEFRNVRVMEGDGARGYGNDTYDVIVLTGSTPLLPERFFEQLKAEGRLFAVVGEAPAMEARLVRQTAPEGRVSVDLFETVVAPLINAATPARFQF